MVEPFSLSFKVFTVKLVSVRKFRSFTCNKVSKFSSQQVRTKDIFRHLEWGPFLAQNSAKNEHCM